MAQRGRPPYIPQCIGYWDPCITCDGGPNLESGEIEVPCSWRNRCQLFQAWLLKQDQSISPEVFLKRNGVKVVSAIVTDLEIGQIPKHKFKKKKKKTKRRLVHVTKAAKKERRYRKTRKQLELFTHILDETLEQVEDLSWVGKRAKAIFEGECYRKDYDSKFVYSGFYKRVLKGRDKRILIARLAPTNGGLDIQIPWKEKPEGCPDRFRWTSWIAPPMMSVIKTTKTEEDFKWVAQLFVQIARSDYGKS